MQNVYIAFGGPDAAFARKLNSQLQSHGIKTFFFENDAQPGQKLHRMMRVGVNEYDRIILICSENSLNRNGVLNEIEECLQREAREGGSERLIPVGLDDYVFDGWRPDRPDLVQAITDRIILDFTRHADDRVDFNRQLMKLVNSLGPLDDVKYITFDSKTEVLDPAGKKFRWTVERTMRPLVPGITELAPRDILGTGKLRITDVNFGEMAPVEVGGATMYKAMFPEPLPQGQDFKHRIVIEGDDVYTDDFGDFVFRDQCFFSHLKFNIRLPAARPSTHAEASKTVGGKVQSIGKLQINSRRTDILLDILEPELGAVYRLYWEW